MVRMKCDFDSTGVLGDIHSAFGLIAIISFISFVVAIPDYLIVSLVSFIIFLASLSASLITSGIECGVIYALENKVVIIHRFYSKKVFVSSIRYSDIRLAKYNVKAVYSRFGFVRYDIILTIFKKSEICIRITSKIDIKENMPTENPDEYKEYLNEHPMVKICSLINEKAENL